ncbi:MAG TPA: asparagine synthase (glutamine-hydrolyzing) [Planctomycetaceae bacterium]|jgi:asparagine synthase (glutamine-hydrolysing)|nr:asparagine synthase (glutamine-hydrolyzing) [Planctomycetaceae bacterium]
MCGIAGLVGNFVPGLIDQMNAAQAHRGPDGSGVFESPRSQVALGHVRLAILDLSEQAAQPMTSEDGRFTLVFNGEIYNFRELRASLANSGLRQTSSGDTQVLLHGLIRWGPAFVERLNGMFAFAFWDDRERELLVVRDPLGIKPVYYAEPQAGSLLFASEIKALCAHPDIRREPDFQTIQQHLTFCHSCSDRTALVGIRRLPPGSLLRWRPRKTAVEIRQYWRPQFSGRDQKENATDVDRLRADVADATRRQLVSDVPIGSFLSGGLDSSLLTAIAAAESSRDNPFRSYTITYPAKSNRLDRAHDDAPYARNLAASLGLDFHEVEIGPQIASLLPQIVYHLDEPIADPAAITCFLICRLAKQHGTKVLLSGQGADELFGGYPRYALLRTLSWFDRLPRAARVSLAQCGNLMPGAFGGPVGASLRRVKRVLGEIHRSPDERFLAYCKSTAASTVRSIQSPAIAHALSQFQADADCLRRMQTGGLGEIDRFLERDLSIYLPNHNLLYTDKMGMAVGVEARVPLLDQEVVDFGTALSVSQKLNPVPKAILRRAARGLVPNDIIDRPKAGFGAPYRYWLRHDLGSMWNDLMNARAIESRGWFRADAVQRLRNQSQTGRADYYMLQWALLTLEIWAQKFIDENPAATALRSQKPRSERSGLVPAA